MSSQERSNGYSHWEQRLLTLLLARKSPISTIDLIGILYKGRQPTLANPRQSVLALVNALARKAKRKRESFRVMKSERNGPKPIEVWIERK